MRALALAITVAALVAAGAAPAAAAETLTVGVGDFFYEPAHTRIDPGDTVTWTVERGEPHTVTSDRGAPEAFDSGDLLPGQSFSRTFAAAGRYPYLCELHPFMTGAVQVGPDTVPPRVRRARAKVGRRAVRLSFALTEGARVSAVVARAARPGRAVRRLRPRRLDAGRRSLRLPARRLGRGRYRVTVVARDPEGNVGRGRVAFAIPRR